MIIFFSWSRAKGSSFPTCSPKRQTQRRRNRTRPSSACIVCSSDDLVSFRCWDRRLPSPRYRRCQSPPLRLRSQQQPQVRRLRQVHPSQPARPRPPRPSMRSRRCKRSPRRRKKSPRSCKSCRVRSRC